MEFRWNFIYSFELFVALSSGNKNKIEHRNKCFMSTEKLQTAKQQR